MIHYKVVLLGSIHAGKTSIIQRFVNGTFSVNTLSSVQAAFFEKQIKIGNSTVILDIWDTAGQERFHSLAPMYYRDANASLIVFDVTDANSFSKAKQWLNELRTSVGNNIILMLIGNKHDLKSIRVVRTEEAAKYAESVGVHYMETSAKTDYQIEDAFDNITKLMQESSSENQTTANLQPETSEKRKYC
ncbi:hypothetical protein M9Y10_021956 [Tritrichomonas musculus]|uniref:Uncharacterized protein n=1 Tax=Tritrichomonas musculus TaxID=1915356 RepID=A0ABR2KQZ3_9EUKA